MQCYNLLSLNPFSWCSALGYLWSSSHFSDKSRSRWLDRHSLQVQSREELEAFVLLLLQFSRDITHPGTSMPVTCCVYVYFHVTSYTEPDQHIKVQQTDSDPYVGLLVQEKQQNYSYLWWENTHSLLSVGSRGNKNLKYRNIKPLIKVLTSSDVVTFPYSRPDTSIQLCQCFRYLVPWHDDSDKL